MNKDGNGWWIAVDELNAQDERTGRRWWYGHLNGPTASIREGNIINAGSHLGIAGDGEAPRHHLHLAVIDTYSEVGDWNEIINGKNKGSYSADVSDVLRRTMSPLYAYWKARNGVKE